MSALCKLTPVIVHVKWEISPPCFHVPEQKLKVSVFKIHGAGDDYVLKVETVTVTSPVNVINTHHQLSVSYSM